MPRNIALTSARKEAEHPPGNLSNENRNDYGMPVHPVCDLFPLMDDIALRVLTNNIRTNGLLNPIVVHEGQLVDGRNRIIACQQAQVEPRRVEWRDVYHGELAIARWIWSMNAERRHLTDDQRIAIEVALRGWEEREAAKRRQVAAGSSQAAHGKRGGRGHRKPLVTDSSQGVSEKNREPTVRYQIAQRLGVSEHRVQQAFNVQKAQPELLKEVAQDKVKLRTAAKRVKPVSSQSERLERAELHARADHDFNYVAHIRAYFDAMALLAEAKYTPQEMARLSARQSFYDLLGATANQASWWCSGVRKEVLNERESRSRKDVAPVPSSKSDKKPTVN